MKPWFSSDLAAPAIFTATRLLHTPELNWIETLGVKPLGKRWERTPYNREYSPNLANRSTDRAVRRKRGFTAPAPMEAMEGVFLMYLPKTGIMP